MSHLKEQLKFEEALRLKKYKCSAGHWTIGYGHNLDNAPYYEGKPIPDTITEAFAEELLDHDIGATIGDLRQRWPRFDGFDKGRRDAFINMAFQLGVRGFMNFERMRAAAMARNWDLANGEAMNSKWAIHDSPERAKRVARQILTGKYYEIPK